MKKPFVEHMTVGKLLEIIEQHTKENKVKWLLDKGFIRTTEAAKETNHRHCPITYVCAAVTGVVYESGDYHAAGYCLNMFYSDMDAVIEMADGQCYGDEPLRQKLLVATGLCNAEEE